MLLDGTRGTATVGAGVSIDELLTVIVPRGFFVPVTPGTRFVTIGGAIASDIHGKNHHVDGSLGNHVESITMMLADGSTIVVGPDRNPGLFWATIGGMGLTGVMLDATIRLLPIETSRMRVDTSRVADVDALFATMSEGDDDVRYSVAWIDLMAKGRHLGRSVLSRGEHALLADLDAEQAVAPFAYGPHQLIAVPPLVPPMGVLNHASIAAFNEFWFRKAPKQRTRRDPGDRRLLPPPRSGRLVEPPVRTTRDGAVPVRRAVRAGGRDAHGRRTTVSQRRRQLPRGAQAVRCRQPGAAQLSAARLDVGARSCRPHREGSATCSTGSTAWCSTPAAATTSPRTRT